MADRVLPRCADSHKIGLRSPEETQRTIDFLLAELTRQQERLDATRIDLHEQIHGMGAALDEAFDRIRALEAENARLREAR